MNAISETGLWQGVNALSIALGELARWLDTPQAYPLVDGDRQSMSSTVSDLQLRVKQMETEPSVLVVVLMGGTGVGKSTLLNALAGSRVADASLVRPTTQFATVYHHRELSLERMAEPVRACRAVVHDRAELRFKVLVDTPDIDGNVREHRERLMEILPAADAVLYVGSQEKYHDREGWRLLLEHRQARGFAFVLNKWDRCRVGLDETAGNSPDTDFRTSLSSAGFPSPLVFRTCARAWADHRLSSDGLTVAIDDDFQQLEQWLNDGLTRRAIQDIKVRGVSGKLEELVDVVERVLPPDWSKKVEGLHEAWHVALRDDLHDHARLLIQATDRLGPAFERHFCKLGRAEFRGLFRWYLVAVDRAMHLQLPTLASLTAPSQDSMQDLVARCVAAIPVDARRHHQESIHARLLAEADRQDWPVNGFQDYLPDPQSALLGDRSLTHVLEEQLNFLQTELVEPTGARRAAAKSVKLLCDWLPWIVLGTLLAYDTYNLTFGILALVRTIAAVLGTILLLHVLLNRVVPVEWHALRPRLRGLIEESLLEKTEPVYLDALNNFASRLASERATATAALAVIRDFKRQLDESSAADAQSSLFAVRKS